MICVEKYKSKNDEKETLINQDWKKSDENKFVPVF